ncbi:MAG: hypothetical protein F6J90_08415 [Moorea sp. SIOASIH]|uniref:hypothetical protein n=1 Tax=Moorena sp. SIOASIH TaxID=2607817 RepID=UPI0013B910C6|nr:hypothetical protein [Moorena sp. SIOASIH]NEO36340.1 hypothetical protein [Moorena sp. SIOASIH]
MRYKNLFSLLPIPCLLLTAYCFLIPVPRSAVPCSLKPRNLYLMRKDNCYKTNPIKNCYSMVTSVSGTSCQW